MARTAIGSRNGIDKDWRQRLPTKFGEHPPTGLEAVTPLQPLEPLTILEVLERYTARYSSLHFLTLLLPVVFSPPPRGCFSRDAVTIQCLRAFLDFLAVTIVAFVMASKVDLGQCLRGLSRRHDLAEVSWR